MPLEKKSLSHLRQLLAWQTQTRTHSFLGAGQTASSRAGTKRALTQGLGHTSTAPQKAQLSSTLRWRGRELEQEGFLPWESSMPSRLSGTEGWRQFPHCGAQHLPQAQDRPQKSQDVVATAEALKRGQRHRALDSIQLLARKGLTQNLPLATSPRGQPGASGQLLLPASRVQANDVQTDDGGLETVEDEVTGSERRRDVPMIHCDPETGRGPRDPASMALAQDQEGNTPSGYLWATGSLHM